MLWEKSYNFAENFSIKRKRSSLMAIKHEIRNSTAELLIFQVHCHWKIQRNSACEGPPRSASGNKYEKEDVPILTHPPFKLWGLLSAYFLAGCIIFQIPAAQAPPMKGPTMKIQRLARAVPPWKMAGAIERAGFTDVPV